MPSPSPSTTERLVRKEALGPPVTAGIVTALVGFTSSFAVVLAGLKAVGANQGQASSGLLALTLTFGLGILWLSWRSKMPVTLAWSTPGAALLASAGMVDGGWPAAVGAFLLVGVLILLTGLLPVLGRIMAKIPTALAQAMLAGVLLPLCLAPFKSLGSAPLLIAPVVLCWIVLMKFAPRWSVPGSLLVALAVIGIHIASNGVQVPAEDLLPGWNGQRRRLPWKLPWGWPCHSSS